jgi:hypothetical protein
MSFCFKIELFSVCRIGSDKHDEFVQLTSRNQRLEFRSAIPLNQSPSWMIRSCGFASKADACEAADDLCQALLLLGAKKGQGVSFDNVEVGPDSTRLILGTIPEFSVAQSATAFANELAAFMGQSRLKKHERVAAELINDVSFHRSSETRFLLSIIAIETLCAPHKKRGERNSQRCQRIIEQRLDKAAADRFAGLYKKRNNFAHEGEGWGVLDNEATEAGQIATRLLLAHIP